ncbi:MAG: methionyl-tRNA formyltransferase [Candidatus Margulisbacteria bacterium]|nr:methionyl-tRNA formyltransferase [Candidatus Margulisiibacteriota bacterium]
MRLIFMGTPVPAAKILETLIASQQHEIVGVITQPDRPKGRGLKLAFSPVKETALHHQLKLEQPDKLKDGKMVRWIDGLKPDVIVVVAYGKILPREILDIPKYGCINVHASLLPKYRGAAPVQWALLNGEKETGITIMRLDEGMDTGDIILRGKIIIDDDINAEKLLEKLFDLGAPLLLSALQQIEKGTAEYQKQNDGQVTFAPSLTKESGEIDWRKSAPEIHNRIRALVPWPSAHTYYQKKALKILASKVNGPVLEKGGHPGEIIQIVKGIGFVIACGQGHLLVTEVQPEGGKAMSAAAFSYGHAVKSGETLPS